jgi:hypothetical protein
LLATANSFKVPVAFTWGPAVALRDGVGVVGVVGVAGGELADSDVDGDGSDGLADGEAGTAMVDAPVGGTWPQPVMPSTAAEPAITAAAIRCLFWGPPRRIITPCWNLRTAIPGATR